jgi:hypothetical protein
MRQLLCVKGIDIATGGGNVLNVTRNIAATPLDEALWAAKRDGKWLAGHLGVNESQVSRWRRGLHTPTAAYQLAIAKALGTTAAELWPPEDEVA